MKKRILSLIFAFVFTASGCGIFPLECKHEYYSDCAERCKLCAAPREGAPSAVHNLSVWKSNGDATCEEDGTRYRLCYSCGKREVDADPDSALGHSYTYSVYNYDATHTTDGTATFICSLCNKLGETHVAEGTAGHCPEGRSGCPAHFSRKCKECGWTPTSLKGTNLCVNEEFEAFSLGKGFSKSFHDSYAPLCVEAWNKKEGVSFTVVRTEGRGETNISALKVERAAVSEEANNDAIVDIRKNSDASDPAFPSYGELSFDLMIGEGNRADVFFSGRKETESGGRYNIFLWYDAETGKLYIDETVVADIVTGVWYTVTLNINEPERCYDVYVDGECVMSEMEYLNSGYPSDEVVAELYRITAMRGCEAVEFYLDNIVFSDRGDK